MPEKSNLEAEAAATFQKSLIANYVQLCLAEGVRPSDAYAKMKRKLQTPRDPENSSMS